MDKYTPEQVTDITTRETKALAALKELQLTPAAQIYKVNIGNDIFADKLVPYLADIKYIKQNETPKEPVKTDKKPVAPVSK